LLRPATTTAASQLPPASYNDGVTSRSSWPVRRYRLGDQPGDDLSQSTTAEERLAMVAVLSSEAWALAGKPLPAYPRHEAPVVRRPWPPRRAG
jgi:hypothetical protein